jgi:hypothetical protein
MGVCANLWFVSVFILQCDKLPLETGRLRQENYCGLHGDPSRRTYEGIKMGRFRATKTRCCIATVRARPKHLLNEMTCEQLFRDQLLMNTMYRVSKDQNSSQSIRDVVSEQLITWCGTGLDASVEFMSSTPKSSLQRCLPSTVFRKKFGKLMKNYSIKTICISCFRAMHSKSHVNATISLLRHKQITHRNIHGQYLPHTQPKGCNGNFCSQ